MHRSLSWMTRRWAAHVQRARDTGAIAVCLGIPEGTQCRREHLAPVAEAMGLRSLNLLTFGDRGQRWESPIIGGPL